MSLSRQAFLAGSSQLCPSCLRMLVSHPQPPQQFLPWSTPSISNTLQCRMPQPSIIYHMYLSVNKSVGSKIMRTKSIIKNVKSMDEPPYPVSLHTHTYTPLHTHTHTHTHTFEDRPPLLSPWPMVACTIFPLPPSERKKSIYIYIYMHTL